MEIKQLKNFVKIIEEGNISRAAQKLNMAQPPLSTQMHQLEAELNCVLFQRGSRNIILTEAGSILYERAKMILSLSDQLPEDIRSLDTIGSVLPLGVISSVSNFVPDTILPDFVRQYPNIRYSIYEKNTYQLIEAVFSNVVELAFVRTPFQNTGLACYPIETNPMYAVGDKRFFEQRSSDALELKDLENTPLIIYRRWEDILQKNCLSCGFHPMVQCICDDARTALHWAEAGIGIGIVPESIISNLRRTGMTAKLITSPSLTSEITLIHLKGKSLSAAAKSLVSYIQRKGYQ